MKLVVLAPSWPSNDGGYGIAIRASLLLYLQFFTKIYFVCLSHKGFQEAGAWPGDQIVWKHVPVSTSPKWARFLQSLFGKLPAITVRYARAWADVKEALGSTIGAASEDAAFIFEDVPIACFLPRVASEFPNCALAVRSHNMCEKAFAPFCHTGPLLHRLSWQLELAKIRRFEKGVCDTADRMWAISHDDANEYMKRFDVRLNGVIGVCAEVERYLNVGLGDAKTVVHVGTADLRKGKGLSDFVRYVWPSVRAEMPEARLLIAGRGTERFADAASGIEGLGFVEDDVNVLGRGVIFVNPQHIGSGVQLKSIVAMLAGKALVSTRMGAEGIEGTAGKHFAVADSPGDMSAQIVSLMRNPEQAVRMGQEARALASEAYSTRRFLEESRPLIEDFISAEPRSKVHK